MITYPSPDQPQLVRHRYHALPGGIPKLGATSWLVREAILSTVTLKGSTETRALSYAVGDHRSSMFSSAEHNLGFVLEVNMQCVRGPKGPILD